MPLDPVSFIVGTTGLLISITSGVIVLKYRQVRLEKDVQKEEKQASLSVGEVRKELRENLGYINTELKTTIGSLNTEIKGARVELNKEIRDAIAQLNSIVVLMKVSAGEQAIINNITATTLNGLVEKLETHKDLIATQRSDLRVILERLKISDAGGAI